MSIPIPGVAYTRKHPNRDWTAPGRPTLHVSAPVTAEVAGAAATTSYAIPPAPVLYVSTTGSDSNDGTSTSPKATVAAAIAAGVSGVTVVVRGGEYREKVGSAGGKKCTIQAYPGERPIFDGSDIVTGFVATGSVWVKSGWTTEFDHSTSYTTGDTGLRLIDPAYPLAAWPDMVFINGVRQTLVSGTPGVGQFAVNYAANTLTIGTNPDGKEVRATVRDYFVILNAADSAIKGITIRRYATSLAGAQATVIGTSAASRMTIEQVVFEDCGQQSLSVRGGSSVVRRSTITRAGCVGIHIPRASDLIIENNHIAEANYRRFKREPISAAMKFSPECHRVKVRYNIIANSYSYGIWFDTDNFDDVIVGNWAYGCAGSAISSEANDNTIIAGNYVEHNSGGFGITSMISSNVKIFNNWVDNNVAGTATSTWDIGLSQDERRNVNPATMGRCPWIIQNAQICNNVSALTTVDSGKLFQVYVLDKSTNIPAPSMVQRIEGNLLVAHDATGTSSNRYIGYDVNGDNAVTGGEIHKTPSTFQATTGWVNYITAEQNPDAADLVAYHPAAVVIPDDVATALGVTPGTRLMGPSRPRPVLAA